MGAILNVILKNEKIEDGIDYDRTANLCDGYTGSDLLELCKKATYFPIRELLDDEKNGKPSSEPKPLSVVDLERVIAQLQKQKLLQVNIADLTHSYQDGHHKENQTIIRINWTAGRIFNLTAKSSHPWAASEYW